MLGIVTNTSASTAQRNLNNTNNFLKNSLEKLSSGLRVNKASDDVAAMAIGSRLNAELSALKTVAVNAGQATSLLQIAEGVYARVDDMLVRMKSLAVQAGNGTLSNTERALLDVEFQALASEINRVSADTTFNNNQLVNSNKTVAVANGNAALFNISTIGNVGNVNALTAATIAITDGATAGTVNLATSAGGYSVTGVDINPATTGDVVGANGLTVTLTSTTNEGAIVITFYSGYDFALEMAGNLDDTNPAAAGTDTTLTVSGNGYNAYDFRIGSGSVPTEDVISANIFSVNGISLGLTGTGAGGTAVSITNLANADRAVQVVDQAINYLIKARATVGANQNRIETAKNNLATTIENTEAAKASYLEADIAAEITEFTSKQILLQSGISTLAQANQIPQNLLALFQQ